MKYPKVLDEFETIRRAAAGASLARIGDGEAKIARGTYTKGQEANPRLAVMMREVMAGKGPALACIPRITNETPDKDRWNKSVCPSMLPYLREGVTYGSSFITRPDVAPHINTKEFWDLVISLWRGKDVVLIRGDEAKSLIAYRMKAAASVEEIVAPIHHAFRVYDELFVKVRKEKRTVLMCLGSTATILAWNLAKEGVHALDLGHVGMFMKRFGVEG